VIIYIPYYNIYTIRYVKFKIKMILLIGIQTNPRWVLVVGPYIIKPFPKQYDFH